MPIIIKVQRTPSAQEEVKKIILKARRTLDGKILIPDHPDLDIVVIPDKNKIVAFPKEEMDDEGEQAAHGTSGPQGTQKHICATIRRRSTWKLSEETPYPSRET